MDGGAPRLIPAQLNELLKDGLKQVDTKVEELKKDKKKKK